MSRFFAGYGSCCHSNHEIEGAITPSREIPALAQRKFASYASFKQAAIPFIRTVPRLIMPSSKTQLVLSTAIVRVLLTDN